MLLTSASHCRPISSRMSSATGRPFAMSGSGRRSTVASNGTPYGKGCVPPDAGRYFVSRVVSICSFANTGEPASLPRNPPICHCLVSTQSASRTSARSGRSKLTVRGRPSSRLNVVIDGNSRRAIASRTFATLIELGTCGHLGGAEDAVRCGERGGDADPVRRHRQHGRGQEPRVRGLVDLAWFDRAYFRQIERLVERADEVVPLPGPARRRGGHQEDRLWRLVVGPGEVERD